MIPIGDNVRSRTFPIVNVTIIALNILIFLYELTLGTARLQPFGFSQLDVFFFHWGTIPACLTDHFGYQTNVPARALTFYCTNNHEIGSVFYSMFLHGGWFHLLGNMIFLWVFGDNVEDAMGHLRYALFYVIVGLAATAAQVAVNQNDLTPSIGASGAIAGVLGAYLVLYPRATVAALLPIVFFIPFHVPAVVLIGFWFLLQLFNGVAAFATTNVVNAGGGVAWFAHVGGFVAGLVLVRLFVLGRSVPPVQRRVRGRRMPW
jgi:membrane associated rhomboid family serine protease